MKNPKVRETANCSRPLQHTIGAHKKVVLPRRYVTGNPFGEPTSDLEGLLKIFKGPNFRVGAPPPQPSQTEKDHATDAGQNRATALRKDRLQNERRSKVENLFCLVEPLVLTETSRVYGLRVFV